MMDIYFRELLLACYCAAEGDLGEVQQVVSKPKIHRDPELYILYIQLINEQPQRWKGLERFSLRN